MKTLIIMTLVLLSTSFCFGQKMLDQVKLKTTLLEQINPSSIPDVAAYQREKFKNLRGIPTSMKLVSNRITKSYRLKGSDDLVLITSLTYEGAMENWEQGVRTSMETFTLTEHGDRERYTEAIKGDGFEAVIYFIKNYKLGNLNYISYKNQDKNIVLIIRYISNSPDEEKIKTMRAIINDLRIE